MRAQTPTTRLKLAELRWVPTGNPGHREQPIADPGLRLAMVRAAVADQPGFVVDDREIRRTGVSYSTAEVMAELRAMVDDRRQQFLRRRQRDT